jgi:hypothetical protein
MIATSCLPLQVVAVVNLAMAEFCKAVITLLVDDMLGKLLTVSKDGNPEGYEIMLSYLTKLAGPELQREVESNFVNFEFKKGLAFSPDKQRKRVKMLWRTELAGLLQHIIRRDTRRCDNNSRRAFLLHHLQQHLPDSAARVLNGWVQDMKTVLVSSCDMTEDLLLRLKQRAGTLAAKNPKKPLLQKVWGNMVDHLLSLKRRGRADFEAATGKVCLPLRTVAEEVCAKAHEWALDYKMPLKSTLGACDPDRMEASAQAGVGDRDGKPVAFPHL